MHLPGCQKSGAFHIRIKKNRVSHIIFVDKKRANHIPGSAEKGGGGGAFGTHIRTMPYIGTHPRPSSCKLSYNIFHSFNPVLIVKNDFVSI